MNYLPKIKLINHRELAALNEVYRLFFACNIPTTEPVAGDVVILSQLQAMENSGHVKVITSVYNCDQPCHDVTDNFETPEQIETVGNLVQQYKQHVLDRELRRELKRQLYLALSQQYGYRFPWGSLTGIRPTQVALKEMVEAERQKQTIEQARSRLVDYWQVSPAKADLALEVAHSEQEVLSSLPPLSPLIYLGLPFCNTRCSYCSFISCDAVRQASVLSDYIKAVLHELAVVCDYLRTKNLSASAFYFGGGTPTSPAVADFAKLMQGIRQNLYCREDAELTVEAGRPDSLNREKLLIIRDFHPHTRICINPQTVHDSTLAKIRRCHTWQDVEDIYQLARDLGFNHINMDLILGLPDEEPEDFLTSVRTLLQMQPESITLHTLSVKRGAHLQLTEGDKYAQMRFPDPRFADALQEAMALLSEQEYRPYYLYRQKNVRSGLENTGFAKPGKACAYNVGMMSDLRTVIGVGSGASTKVVVPDGSGRVERQINSKDLRDYTLRVDEMIAAKLHLLDTFYCGVGE